MAVLSGAAVCFWTAVLDLYLISNVSCSNLQLCSSIYVTVSENSLSTRFFNRFLSLSVNGFVWDKYFRNVSVSILYGRKWIPVFSLR